MPRHFADLDANAVETAQLTAATRELKTAIDGHGICVFVGDPGTGKDFAFDYACERLTPTLEWARLQFAQAPMPTQVAHGMLRGLGENLSGYRSAPSLELAAEMQAELHRPVVVREAQHWGRVGLGALRQIYDQSGEAFAIVLSGSEDFDMKLRRYGCLRRRASAGLRFEAMEHSDVLRLLPGYHARYAKATPKALGIVNAAVCHGRWGHWAAFTHRFKVQEPRADTLTEALARRLVRGIRTV